MSGTQASPGSVPGPGRATATGTGEAAGNDPSMEDILASIRRILSEEEPAPGPAATEPEPADKSDEVLVLDASMLVPDEPAPSRPEPPSPPPPPRVLEAAIVPPPRPLPVMTSEPTPPAALVAPEAAAAAASAMGSLLRTLAAERTLQVRQGGLTIEDIVREELRPLLKAWLDAHLPEMVERLVQAEIQRVVGRGSVP